MALFCLLCFNVFELSCFPSPNSSRFAFVGRRKKNIGRCRVDVDYDQRLQSYFMWYVFEVTVLSLSPLNSRRFEFECMELTLLFCIYFPFFIIIISLALLSFVALCLCVCCSTFMCVRSSREKFMFWYSHYWLKCGRLKTIPVYILRVFKNKTPFCCVPFWVQ